MDCSLSGHLQASQRFVPLWEMSNICHPLLIYGNWSFGLFVEWLICGHLLTSGWMKPE